MFGWANEDAFKGCESTLASDLALPSPHRPYCLSDAFPFSSANTPTNILAIATAIVTTSTAKILSLYYAEESPPSYYWPWRAP
jgi:hypothetical protein